MSRLWWPLALALLCSCQCNGGAGSADSRPPDSRTLDTGVSDRSVKPPDLTRPPDTRGADADLSGAGPDMALPGGCTAGAKRTIKLKPELPYAALPCGKGCKQVTFGNTTKPDYDLHGDILTYGAWRPETAGPTGKTSPKVYYVDLKTGKEWRLHDDGKQTLDGCSLVATDGQRIAYVCLPQHWSGPGALYYNSITLYDIKTQTETDLACVLRINNGTQCAPFGSGLAATGIVLDWSLGPCKTTDALFFRFSTGKLENLSNTKGLAGGVQAEGKWVVWQQGFPSKPGRTDGPDNIVLYDTTTGKKTRIDPQASHQCGPRIGGGKVVWVDHRNSKGKGSCWSPDWGDIYVHDIATQKTTAVSTHPAMQHRPDVWGDWVAWHDWRNAKDPNPGNNASDNADIFARDLKAGKTYQLTSYPGLETRPRIYKKTIIFRMLDQKKDVSLFAIDLAKRLAQ